MATNYDMEAIHEAYPYPAVCRIECGGPDEGIWDADGNAVTVDQSKVLSLIHISEPTRQAEI